MMSERFCKDCAETLQPCVILLVADVGTVYDRANMP